MKKLKIKVFSTIFIILTIFVIFVLGVNQYQNYNMQVKSIHNVLNKLPNSLEDKNPPPKKEQEDTPDKGNKFFLDFTVYTVILDDNGNYFDLINHSENNVDTTKIKKIVSTLVKNHKENLYIGNLYLEKYSYCFSQNNTLTIIDNTTIQDKLIKSLISSIFLFVTIETIVIILSYFLTKWIIQPVITSFQKQKEFIEDASHELKTPLSVILASTDAYFIKKEDRWVKNIQEEASRMTKLVLEMLELAKTDKITKEVYTKENLSTILEKNILTFESMMFDKKIKLTTTIEKDIYLLMIKEQIEKLIHILLDNAVEHSEKEGEIIVLLEKNNKEIILEVKNKGLPIKKGEEKNIFERFYRADKSRNRNHNHYGLGLAIAKSFIEVQGGTFNIVLDGDLFKVIIKFNK